MAQRTERVLPPSSARSVHHSYSVSREYGAGLAGDLDLVLSGALARLDVLVGVGACTSSSSDEMTWAFCALALLDALALGFAAGFAAGFLAFLGGGETTSTSESLETAWSVVSAGPGHTAELFRRDRAAVATMSDQCNGARAEPSAGRSGKRLHATDTSYSLVTRRDEDVATPEASAPCASPRVSGPWPQSRSRARDRGHRRGGCAESRADEELNSRIAKVRVSAAQRRSLACGLM